MPNYGIITKIYTKKNMKIDAGEFLDVESGEAYPFEVATEIFELNERVCWESDPYSDDDSKDIRLFKS